MARYLYTGPITVTPPATLKFVAQAADNSYGEVQTAAYELEHVGTIAQSNAAATQAADATQVISGTTTQSQTKQRSDSNEPSSVFFDQQPTASQNVINYSTNARLFGEVVEQQNASIQDSVGVLPTLKFSTQPYSVGNTLHYATEEIVYEWLGDVSQSAAKQAQVANALITLLGILNQTQVQTQAANASLAFIAAVNQDQRKNTSSIAGSNDNLNEVWQLTPVQQQIANGLLKFEAQIAEQQKSAYEDGAGSLIFTGAISGYQSAAQQALNANLALIGQIAHNQAIQSQNAEGLAAWDALFEAQPAQIQEAAASLLFTGAINATQAQQVQAIVEYVRMMQLKVVGRDMMGTKVVGRDCLTTSVSGKDLLDTVVN